MALDADLTGRLSGARVLLTGHTGFKGAWLGLWLERLGAQVSGLSLPPDPSSLYARGGLAGRWPECLYDIRDPRAVADFMARVQPDLVFHLAAQPLVGAAYEDPMATFDTNVMGTVNVLEAVRCCPTAVGCVVVTTDKVYRPTSTAHRHIESDPLGAPDPYSASKAAAEHAVASWRSLVAIESGRCIVAARAGNVIGGGDLAHQRLLPDLVRSFSNGLPCEIRHPEFTRPWQHVLDPLHGYILLGLRMLEGQCVPDAVNFGPDKEETVAKVADIAVASWGGTASWEAIDGGQMPETALLGLDSGLAERALGWRPRWTTQQAVDRTIQWWKGLYSGSSPIALCHEDIVLFEAQGSAP